MFYALLIGAICVLVAATIIFPRNTALSTLFLMVVLALGTKTGAWPIAISLLIILGLVLSSAILRFLLFEFIHLHKSARPARRKTIYLSLFKSFLLFLAAVILGLILYLGSSYILQQANKWLIYNASFTNSNSVYTCGTDNKIVCVCDDDSAFVWLSNHDEVEVLRIESPLERSKQCPTKNMNKWTNLENSNFQNNIHYAVDRVHDAAKSEILENVKSVLIDTKGMHKQAGTSAMQKMFYNPEKNVAFPRNLKTLNPALEPPNCSGIRDWIKKTGDCIMRRVLKPLNKTYDTELRPNLHDRLYITIEESGREFNTTSEKTIQFTEKFLNEEFEVLRKDNHRSVRLVIISFKVLSFLGLFFWMLSSLISGVIVFLYLFYRQVYDELNVNEDEVNFDSKRLNQTPLPLSKTGDGGEATLELKGNKVVWLVQRGNVQGVHTPARQQSKRSFEQLSHHFFERLFIRKISLREFDSSKHESIPFKYSAMQNQIIKVDIPEGTKVVVNYANVLGFTKGIKIRRSINIRLSFFLSGHFFHTMIEGQGTVLIVKNWSDKKATTRSNGPLKISPENESIALIKYEHFYKLDISNRHYDAYLDDHTIIVNDKSSVVTQRVSNVDWILRPFRRFIQRLMFVPLPLGIGAFVLIIYIWLLNNV